MFEKIIQQADQAGTRLSQSLSAFEKSFTDLKVRFSDEIASFEEKSSDSISKCNKATSETISLIEMSCARIAKDSAIITEGLKEESNRLVSLMGTKITDLKEDTLREFESTELKIKEALASHTANLNKAFEDNLALFSNTVEARFEGIYADFEDAAKNRAEKIFETDLEKIFEKYSDRLVPLILKAVWSYILRLGRKK